MDLTWQCVDAHAAADVVQWRDAGQLGAAALGASWFESAESRVTDACVQSCSPTNDCFHGQCTGPDGSAVVYDQNIVGEGSNVETVTIIDVYPVDGTAWDRLTVSYTDTRSDDGTTSLHSEQWLVSWEGLLVAEWPQDASFVAFRESGSHFSGTVQSLTERWLDRTCGWSSNLVEATDATDWTIEMGTETITVRPAADCPGASWSDVDGTPEGYVDPETWVSLGETCPGGADPGDGDATGGGEGCGCASSGGPSAWLGAVALVGIATRRRRS